MNEKVLIIEDEKDISKVLEHNLNREGYSTIIAFDGHTAIRLAQREKPDIIILDIMLPGIDGLEVCKHIKSDPKTSNAFVLMLTAKSTETDKVVGLELGADDYMTKPFSIRELLARIKAALRRFNKHPQENCTYKDKNLHVDFEKIEVRIKDKTINLTAKEFELLKAMIKSNGRVISREKLLEIVWGYGNADIMTRTVDVHIMTLRKKLKTEGHRIVTVKNYGYRFIEALGA